MRADLEIIQDWIPYGSRVLDLGCGDGSLLQHLQKNKNVTGYGLEINPNQITACLQKGVQVIEQDLDQGLANFADHSFDVVIMTQSLQALRFPDRTLSEMLRIGHTSIVTFPNFAHWRCRWYLARNGKMPISDFLPYTWYNTPNIHFCTFKDFEALCHSLHIQICTHMAVNRLHKDTYASRLWPNLMGEIGIYRLRGSPQPT